MVGACTSSAELEVEAAPEPPTAASEAPPEEPASPAPASPAPATPAAPQPAPPAPPVAPVPASREALSERLDRVLARAVRAAPDLELGVLVVDAAGREVVALEPDTPRIPASTLKQVTAAATLTTLGSTAQLRTLVEATAGIDGDGVLAGDLVLVGVGDPTLVTEEYARFIYPARPRTSLDALADQVAALGLTHVTGQVRGSAPAFAPPSLPSGWTDSYLDTLDGRYHAGLTVDAGLVTAIELPDIPDEDEEADDADQADEKPEEDEEEEDEPDIPINILTQLAALDTDLPPTVRTRLAPDPVLHAAAELTRMLRERGVEVAGPPTTEPATLPIAARLGVVTSPPMEELLRFTVQRSDNHLADALALVVARARTRQASWASVPRAYEQVLERFEVPTAGAAFADGSGLSRDDRLTPRQLTELDRRLTGSARFGGTWRSLQAVAGVSGTLDGRYRGTPAEGRLLGKTGTLRDVSALTGQVIGADADPIGPAAEDERRYHLAVLANATEGPGRAVTRAVVDELVLALTADLDGCRLEGDGDVDGPLGRPPMVIRCGSD